MVVVIVAAAAVVVVVRSRQLQGIYGVGAGKIMVDNESLTM